MSSAETNDVLTLLSNMNFNRLTYLDGTAFSGLAALETLFVRVFFL
jgi:hypothetical protein